jgi:hypothetical protein
MIRTACDWRRWALLAGLACVAGARCSTEDSHRAPNLGSMMAETTSLKINEHKFQVWAADDDAERARGLMFVTADQMAPLPDGSERGMWFMFPRDQTTAQGFWMKDTIIPLDIAFVRADGRIVTIRTMAPRDESSYYSKAPYRYALEVNGNLFSRLGIREGHRIDIPKSLLKTTR